MTPEQQDALSLKIRERINRGIGKSEINFLLECLELIDPPAAFDYRSWGAADALAEEPAGIPREPSNWGPVSFEASPRNPECKAFHARETCEELDPLRCGCPSIMAIMHNDTHGYNKWPAGMGEAK